jgi:hypothetical protein
MRFARRLVLFAAGFSVAAGSAATAQSGAPYAVTGSVPIVRTAGACPRRIAVTTTTQPYEGGGNVRVVLRLAGIATNVGELVPRRGAMIAFAGTPRAAYATCEGSGRTTEAGMVSTFTFHAGKLRATVRPSPEVQEIRARVVNGNPTITGAVAD